MATLQYHKSVNLTGEVCIKTDTNVDDTNIFHWHKTAQNRPQAKKLHSKMYDGHYLVLKHSNSDMESNRHLKILKLQNADEDFLKILRATNLMEQSSEETYAQRDSEGVRSLRTRLVQS